MGEHCARDVPVGFRWPFVTLVVLSSWTADSLRQLHTNTSESIQHQITMFRERIRTVWISLLGGKSGIYDLGIAPSTRKTRRCHLVSVSPDIAPVQAPMHPGNGEGSFSWRMIDVASTVDRHVIMAYTYKA
ncbi:hypothetical protein EDD16DRAFT_1486638 [Pisolithus croceorrhizus]|nr:hypothetical protein EDD16DRAFT_1486638 [Pisolithus croceorrhizus]KAI6133550.1 hypothetical protein EV401DRAFT_1848648 [Pisolithus croceorrhizus]KAI6165696.1 hypothetical protein EDD17DRAFT_1472459 [Pisolithus thermaeus]